MNFFLKMLNRLLYGKRKQNIEFPEEIILDVIHGRYGNGIDRRIALTEAGYDYNEVQTKVNEYLTNLKNEV